MSEPIQKHEVKYTGVSHIFGLTAVSSPLKIQGHDMIELKDVSGALRIVLPAQMVPFAQVGATVMVNLGLVAGEVVASSAILRVVP